MSSQSYYATDQAILMPRQQVYSPSSIMNLDRLADRARRPFWRPSWNLPLPATVSP